MLGLHLKRHNGVASACAGAGGFSSRWDSAGVSPGHRLVSRSQQRLPTSRNLWRLGRREDVELWNLDECHLLRHGNRCRMWAPPELGNLLARTQPPAIPSPVLAPRACGRTKSLLRCAQNSTRSNLWHFSSRSRVFLFRSKRKVIVLDIAICHDARLLAPWLRKQRRALAPFFCRPTAPNARRWSASEN